MNTGTRFPEPRQRSMVFRQIGKIDAPSYDLDSLKPGESLIGPAIVESHFSTIVIDPAARAERCGDGSFVVNVRVDH
jgi:N-methylhydantoinase A